MLALLLSRSGTSLHSAVSVIVLRESVTLTCFRTAKYTGVPLNVCYIPSFLGNRIISYIE